MQSCALHRCAVFLFFFSLRGKGDKVFFFFFCWTTITFAHFAVNCATAGLSVSHRSVLFQALVWPQKGHRYTWQPSSAERIEDRTLRALLVHVSGVCSSRLMVETHSRIWPFWPATDLLLLKARRVAALQ